MIIPSPSDLREAAAVLRAEVERLDTGDPLATAKGRMLALHRVVLWVLWCAGDPMDSRERRQ